MLVITRRVGDAILVDGGIEIKLLRIDGNQVKLGIDAPVETRVVRAELVRSNEEDRPDV